MIMFLFDGLCYVNFYIKIHCLVIYPFFIITDLYICVYMEYNCLHYLLLILFIAL